MLCVFATLAVLSWARPFLVPLAFSFLLTLCLNPLVSRLGRLGLPRPLGAFMVLGALITLACAALLSLQDDAQSLLAELPAAVRHFRQMLMDAASDRGGWWQRLNMVARSTGAVTAPAATSSPVLPVPVIKGDIGTTLVHGSRGAVVLLGQLAVVLFLVYFLLIAKVPRSGKPGAVTRQILRDVAGQVQRYIGLLAATNLLLGLATWAAFVGLGVSHAAVWGIAAGVMHFIPYAGPAAVAAGSTLAAAVQFESLGTGLLVGAVSLGLSTVIGVIVTTWLSGRAARINTATMFVGLLFWGWLWGLPGLLLGAPMMMTLKTIADRLPALAWLSRMLNCEPDTTPDSA